MTGRGPCSAMRLSICERNYASPISRFDLEVCNSIFLEYGTRLSFEIASCVGRLFRVRDQFFKGAKLGLY